MSKIIAVTGATGQQGGSVVKWLLKEPAGQFTIRAITRSPESAAAKALLAQGVEVFRADLAQVEQVTTAFTGAWGIFGLTQFYEHGYEAEQLYGKNIVDACTAAGVKHIGECAAIRWTSKAQIGDRVIKSGIPCTSYYENFWTSFFAPAYDEEKGFNWSVGFLPDVPIFAFSVDDFGAEPEIYTGKKIKIVVEYLTLRDLATQFSEATGEKASLAVELTREQFEASRYADHPAAEFMYLSWEYIIRAGPDSGVRLDPTLGPDQKQLSMYPAALTYRKWVKESQLVKYLIAKLKSNA
ncbi:NmrA family protein [Mycena epipterygia]|nr:NmrA family protein [Mycena epipterygia]